MNGELIITIEQRIEGRIYKTQCKIEDSILQLSRVKDSIIAEEAFSNLYRQFKIEKEMELANLQYKPASIPPWEYTKVYDEVTDTYYNSSLPRRY